MTGRLSLRGPDAAGYWSVKQAGFGHQRLIVVDPEGGIQPMIRNFGDQIYALTYNGELYNTSELRRELETKGHIFKSYSDTEVVLIAYIEWGSSCVERFNGIFAFGIWDDSKQILFLARDRLGVKPLFYTKRGHNTFLFSSEIKALLAHPKVIPEIDQTGLAEIFGLGPAHTPGLGVFREIFELRPGSLLLYDQNGIKIQKYWGLDSKPHFDDLDTTALRVRELLEDSIKRQLVSDVPVCTLLSGGLDSSIISAVAAGEYQRTGRNPLHTYSINYLDNDQYFQSNDFQPGSDEPWIDQVSGYLETKHHRVMLDTPQLVAALEQAVLARDLPGMADIDSSLYLFCREIKKGATVALSGECADELFGGYPWFHRPEAFNSNTFPWSLDLRVRNHILSRELKAQLNLKKYIAQRYQATLAEVPRLPGEDPIEAKRRELFYLNINWFMAVLLERKDRMGMASGVEIRVPFCDHRLVEYVWNIPWSLKNCDRREKGILRHAVKGLLPKEVIERRKNPYPKTYNPTYLTAVKELLLQILTDSSSRLKELIDLHIVKEIALFGGKDYDRPWFGQLMTRPQLLAYLIQIEIWLRAYKIKISF
jgi:asparagine synthase (glutamine-hydrolysing)